MTEENEEEVESEVEHRNIYIVPTSHASEESSLTVRNVINAVKPDLIAIELDQKRLHRLKQDDELDTDRSFKDLVKGSKGVGVKGRIMLVLFGMLQSDVASKLGIDLLGMDMLSGYEASVENEIPLALVDRNIDETFKRFSSEVSVRESLKSFFYMAIAYVHLSRMSDDEVEEELGKDQEDIDVSESVEAMEETFPTFKRVLIDERDEHIAQSTYDASKKFGDTVLVIGAAHESGVTRILSQMEDVTVHSVSDEDFHLDVEE